MNTISLMIITSVASVLISLVIGLFIWSIVKVRKLLKKDKDNQADFESIQNQINNFHNDMNLGYENLLEIHNNFVSDVYRVIDDKLDKDNYDELRKELDKRFDKVYLKVNQLIEHSELRMDKLIDIKRD